MQRIRIALLQVLQRATSKSILKPPAIIFIVVAQAILHFVASVDLHFSYFWLRGGLSIVATAPLFILVFLANLRPSNEWSRQVLVIFSFIAGGALRGLIIHEGLVAAELIPPSAPAYRVGSSTLVMTLACGTTAFGFSNLERVTGVISDLRQQTNALQQALVDLRVTSTREEMERIRGLAAQITQDLLRVGEFAPGIRASRLEQIVNQTVRPLSHAFAREVPTWKPEEVQPKPVRFRDLWHNLDLVRTPPSPLSTSAMAATSMYLSARSLFPLRLSLTLVATMGFSLYLAMKLVFPAARSLLQGMNSPFREMFITFTLVLVSLPPLAISSIVLANTKAPFIYYPTGVVLVPLFGWFLMIARAAWLRLTELTLELERTRRRLEWLTARINLLSWYHRGFVSRLLHGPIQNTIQVGLISLQTTESDDHTEILNAVIRRIEAAVHEALEMRHNRLGDLQQVEEMWQAVAALDLEIDPNCRDRLAQDPAAANIIVDLVQEACSNAIRHGKASQVAVLVDCADDEAVISFFDNGAIASLPVRGAKGIGTVFLNACTTSWQRSHHDGRNALRMHIPISVQ